MKRLSIIIPIYNVEPYVKRCLRSLELQDIPSDDYEIICINDGSPDESRAVVIQMQQEYNNIILIDQENQGVSLARNNGINRASGKYYLFIDPDDYIETNCFERILKNAEIKKAQVSFLGFTILNENGTIRQKIFNRAKSTEIYSGIETYHMAHGDDSSDPDRTWAVLFDADFLNKNNLRFLPDVPYLEDGELIARVLCLAERCIFDGNSFYQRTTRPGSATNSRLFHSEKATQGFFHAAINLKKFQEEQILNEKQIEFLNQPICKFVVLVVSSSRKPFSLKSIRKAKKMLHSSGFRNLQLDSVDKEFTRLGIIYNISISLLILYEFLINRIKSFRLRLNQISSKKLETY